jgi:hypothetical protein
VGPVIGFVAAVFFGAAAGASAAYVLAVNLARIALLSLASKLSAPKIDLTTAAQNKMLTVRSTVQPQGYTYGEDMLSGPLIFANTAGSGNNDLHRVVALHGREIDSFLAYRIDDFDIVVGTEIATESGVVTGGRFADVVEIEVKHGSPTQTVLSTLNTAFSTLWTSAGHRARGWSLLYTKMTLKDNNDAFENGIPQNLRALVKGHKVYDPRLDSTQPGGASPGPHRVDDDTTWEWSNNPALCLADFWIWNEVGMGEETDRIDWPLVMTAADICEEQVPVPPCTSPQVSFQNRYTCNFTFFATQNRGEILEMLTTSMLGRTVFSQGQWRMWAGAVQTPDVVLTEANLAGAIQMQASSGSQERYNRVRGKFIDPTRDYSANSYPEIRNAGFEASDTEVRYQVFDINTCNNSFEAQRDAIHKLRMSRNQRTIVWAGNWSCFRIQPGTIVQLSIAELGLDTSPLPKYFVTEWSLQKDGSGVSLTMVEEDDTVWTDPDCTDYVIRSPTGELIFQNQGGDVNLFDADIHNETLTDDECFSGLELNVDGRVYHYRPMKEGGSSPPLPLLRLASPGQWLLNDAGSTTGNWFARATMNTSPDPGLNQGTLDTWLNLSNNRSWDILRSIIGTDEANITVEITDNDADSPPIILATGQFDLIATMLGNVRFPDQQVEEHIAWDGSTPIDATAGIRFANDDYIESRIEQRSPKYVRIQKWWFGPGSSPTTYEAIMLDEGTGFEQQDAAEGVWFSIRLGGFAEEFNSNRNWFSHGFGTSSNTGVFGIGDSANSPQVTEHSFTLVTIASLDAI